MEKDNKRTDEEEIARKRIEQTREEAKGAQDWLDKNYSKEAKRKVKQNLRDNYYLFRDIQTKGHGSVNIISKDEDELDK